MKKLIFLAAGMICAAFIWSCSEEYKGSMPDNNSPVLHIYDTTDSTSSKRTKIKWYGNDIDGMKMKYYYIVTTDTTLNETEVFEKLPLDVNELKKWNVTGETYAFVSLPYYNFNSDTMFVDLRDYGNVVTVTGDTVHVTFRAVFSKFFVLGIDEEGTRTPVRSKIFKRTNIKPKHPMVYSKKLGINGFEKYWMTVGPDSAQLVLPEETAYWKAFDFKWMGDDPDGSDVGLEFRWELHELRQPHKPDTLVTGTFQTEWNGTDSVKIPYWSSACLSKTLSKEIYYHNPNGRYSFRVWVRDDAFEESEHNATVNFEVFASKLTRGILYIDDTDPSLYPPPGYTMWMGNPDNSLTKPYYEELIESCGYRKEGDMSVDSTMWYRSAVFERTMEENGKTYYSPDIRELTKYRLVIISSDDRSNFYGVNFMGEAGYAGYRIALKNYLDVGGKVFLAGPSVLLGQYFEMTPSQLPVNKYQAPFRQYFERDIFDGVENAGGAASATNTEVRMFFNNYFGIYFMNFPEQKTYYTIPGTNDAQYLTDHYLADNYDFIGCYLYGHIKDIPVEKLRIDSVKVNKAWFDSPPGSGGRIRQHALKDRGTVFTGVPTFETYKGEIVFGYMSLYDLPAADYDPDIVFDFPWESPSDTLKHSLKLMNRVTGEVAGKVLKRSGSVAARYIADNDLFRTAFFTMPLYFMDNSDGQVNSMFKAMIEWFEIKDK
jgi:hypothetical protein